MIKDEYNSNTCRKILANCFVQFDDSQTNNLSKRLQRQKGLFLVCGQDENSKCNSIAKLSLEYGRGESYGGFFYNLPIKKEYVDKIREQLEKNNDYNMNYLLGLGKGA